MLIENNKMLRQMAHDGGTDVTNIAGIGPAHPPPPPAPLMHMETSPGLPMTTLTLDDNDSNASVRSRDSPMLDEPGECHPITYSLL